MPMPATPRLASLIDELLLAGPNAVATAKGLLRRLTQTPISKELLAELQSEFDARRHSPEATEGRRQLSREAQAAVGLPGQE